MNETQKDHSYKKLEPIKVKGKRNKVSVYLIEHDS